jgi:hypothetical protein
MMKSFRVILLFACGFPHGSECFLPAVVQQEIHSRRRAFQGALPISSRLLAQKSERSERSLQGRPSYSGGWRNFIRGYLSLPISSRLFGQKESVIEKHTPKAVNGEKWLDKLDDVTLPVPEDELFPNSPPLTDEKFVTMQEKRVVVTVRYSGGAGLKPYFLTVAKKLKASHPDVLLERLILPSVDHDEVEAASFEVLVDGKKVIGNGRSSKQKVGQDMAHARSVFVSMQAMDAAISRSRRKRRPSTVYGDEERSPDFARLEMLRKIKEMGKQEND